MVLMADRRVESGARTRVSMLAWKSSKLRRRVSSTLAGESLALSAAVAEVQWFQLLWRDALYGDVTDRSSLSRHAPFLTVLSRNCSAPKNERQLHVVDAKSCYDALIKGGSGSSRDRRTAIELAIVAEDMARSGAAVRWVPHSRMVVDVLTKADVSHTNAALSELVRSGHLQLVDEQREIVARGVGESSKSRSLAASKRALESATAECDVVPVE